MSNPNFAALLDEAPTEINRPKPLPQGTYLCTVTGWETGESSKKKTPFVRFSLLVIAADDDVDAEELEASGGFEGKTLRTDYYITADAVYRLDEFHEHCGLDITDEVSRKMRNDEVVNTQVKVYVKHRASADGESVYAEVGRTLSAD